MSRNLKNNRIFYLKIFIFFFFFFFFFLVAKFSIYLNRRDFVMCAEKRDLLIQASWWGHLLLPIYSLYLLISDKLALQYHKEVCLDVETAECDGELIQRSLLISLLISETKSIMQAYFHLGSNKMFSRS